MKDKYNIDFDLDFQQVVSTNDCTGLIPANNIQGEYDEVYRDIYNYTPPYIHSEKKDSLK